MRAKSARLTLMSSSTFRNKKVTLASTAAHTAHPASRFRGVNRRANVAVNPLDVGGQLWARHQIRAENGSELVVCGTTSRGNQRRL